MVERRWAELPDRELVRLVQHPDDDDDRLAAFGQMFERYRDTVIARCSYYLSDLAAAEDAAAVTFEDAFGDLCRGDASSIEDPDKLRAWLRGIARNRCQRALRERDRLAALPDDVADDDDDLITEARTVTVGRMMAVVDATFTDAERRDRRLVVDGGLRGKGLASALGVSAARAYNVTDKSKKLVYRSFGAYALALHGREHCPKLGRILDRYGWDGDNFSPRLRKAILRHLDKGCASCDNCGVCLDLVGDRGRLRLEYAPVLVPILVGPDVVARVTATVDRIDTEQRRQRKRKRPNLPPPALPPDDETPRQRRRRERAEVNRLRPVSARSGASGLAGLALLLRVLATAYPDQAREVTDAIGQLFGQEPSPTLTLTVSDPRMTLIDPSSGRTCNAQCEWRQPRDGWATITASVPSDIVAAGGVIWSGCFHVPGHESADDTSTTGPCYLRMDKDRTVCLRTNGDNATLNYCLSRGAG